MRLKTSMNNLPALGGDAIGTATGPLSTTTGLTGYTEDNVIPGDLDASGSASAALSGVTGFSTLETEDEYTP